MTREYKLRSRLRLHLIISMFIMITNGSRLKAQELPLEGATEYSVRTPETYGLAWAFSEDLVYPEEGEIIHNAGVAVDYLGLASYSVFNGILSDTFQVNQNGPYRLRITGLIDINIIEGSSASIGGVSASGGAMMRGGGLTTASVTDTLYQTDFSIWSYLYEASWAAIMIVIDRWLDGSGTVSEILTEIRNQLEPTINWTNRSFSLDSYDWLESGINYHWSFWIGSAVAAAGAGDIHETALFEAYIRDLHVELEYMGDPVYNIYSWCGRNGGIYPLGDIIVPQGEELEFTAYPEMEYEVRNWYLDGDSVQIGGNTYTLSNIQASHNIFVNFEPTDEGRIWVDSPEAGDTVFSGRGEHIIWRFEGDVGEHVKIDLFKAGSPYSPIDDYVNNIGHYRWDVPHELEEDSDYQVRVASLDGSISDLSECCFSIIPLTVLDTIRIYTVEELQQICEDDMHPRDGYYLLMNNIDAGDISNFDPIGDDYQHYFRGTFDGQGYTISDLQIDRPTEENIGLFAALMDNGLIKNLTVADDGIYGYNLVGALVGECAGTVINCHALIEDLQGRADPDGGGGNGIGGLVGENTNSGVILNCSVSSLTDGEVRTEGDSPDGIGGLAGINSGQIKWCWSDVIVDATVGDVEGDEVGGLVGSNNGLIAECFSNSQIVYGEYQVGGVVGFHSGSGNIIDCYSSSRVHYATAYGGLAGETGGNSTIDRCLSNGLVYNGAGTNGGALIGEHYTSVSNSFWNRDRTGIDQPIGYGGGTVINCHSINDVEARQMVTYTTQYSTNWDFANVWAIDDGVSYPGLRGAGPMLSPPSGLMASSDQSDGVHLSWNERSYYVLVFVPDEPPDSIGSFNAVYRVYRSEYDDIFPPETEVTDGWQTAITFVDTMAIPGISYYYSVKAATTVNGARESDFGNYVYGLRAFPPLYRPTGVSASDGLTNSVLIEWNAVPDANFYRVFRADSLTGVKDTLGDWQTEIAFSDTPSYPDTSYYYWIKAAVDDSGGRESDFGGPDEGYYIADPLAVDDENVLPIPEAFSLSQNYPNPFNASTVIKYALPQASDVLINIYDILGRKVETLIQGEQQAGYHQITWDASDHSSGMYFYRIQAGEYAETKKMVLLK